MMEKDILEKIEKSGILKKHNIEAYINVVKMFENVNKVCIEHATGTGKSFIALQLMYDNPDKKIIYLVPRNGIGDQVEEHIMDLSPEARKKYFPNVTIKTYQSLLNMPKEELESLDVDYLITDEYHHLTTNEWGNRINIIEKSHPNLKIFGMSATPIRDNNTNKIENVSETFFEENVASRFSLAQAIATGVLKAPKYVTTKYDFLDEINKLENIINTKSMSNKNKEKKLLELEKLKEKAKKKVNEAPSFNEIIKNNLKPNGKYIVFCPRGGLEQTMENAKYGWLNNIATEKNRKTYFATSAKIKESRKNQEEFYHDNDDSKLRIMFAMDMYNEGIHVPDIDGVIMLRPSKSEIIFYQQLGRALACMGDKTPLVLDFVNNIYSVKNLVKECKSILNSNDNKIPLEGRIDDFNISFDLNADELELLEMLEMIEESFKLSSEKKVEEFIEIINAPENINIALTSSEMKSKCFSNGDRIGEFWSDHKDKIKSALKVEKYISGYEQAKRKVFPIKIDKISEFIEIINAPENINLTVINSKMKSKCFSNGDKVGFFWHDHKDKIKNALISEKYISGYEQAKIKVGLIEIDKISEFIEIINAPENINIALTSSEMKSKCFSNGDKVGFFWDYNKDKIKSALKVEKYISGYEQAKRKVFPIKIDKISEFIEIINAPENINIAFSNLEMMSKCFSNGDKVGSFALNSKEKIKNALKGEKYISGYEQAKIKVGLIEIDKISEFIEILNAPENINFTVSNSEMMSKYFSNGDKVGAFWTVNKEKIKNALKGEKYILGYEQAKRKVFPIEIDKISEFIEIINAPENSNLAFSNPEMMSKYFSNGDKVGSFWALNKEKIKNVLIGEKYISGYEQAKRKVFPIDKISEFIEIINTPENSNLALTSSKIQSKCFSNGDKVGEFWTYHKDKIKSTLIGEKYISGYEQAKIKAGLVDKELVSYLKQTEISNEQLNSGVVYKDKDKKENKKEV